MKQDLVDLHCHLLPGIDDGAKDIGMTLALLRQELADGAAGLVFTPHFYYERTTLEEFAAKRKAALRQTAEAVRREGLPLAAKAGAEVYYTPVLPTLDLSQLCFAGTRYLLIELPTTFHPSGIEDTLYAVQQQGYTPILAHVERYPYVTEDPTLLYRWVAAGALAQVNAAGLIRGGHTAKLLHKYLHWNLVHLLATDAHHPERRPVNLRAGYEALPEKTAARLRQDGIQVFLGRDGDPGEPNEPKFPFGRWV